MEEHFAFALLLSPSSKKIVYKMANKNSHIMNQLKYCDIKEEKDGHVLFISEWDKRFDWSTFKSIFKNLEEHGAHFFFIKESNFDVVTKGHIFINPFNFKIERRFSYVDKEMADAKY